MSWRHLNGCQIGLAKALITLSRFEIRDRSRKTFTDVTFGQAGLAAARTPPYSSREVLAVLSTTVSYDRKMFMAQAPDYQESFCLTGLVAILKK
jgi:hypothetical protein